jgi:transcriptional antiterminator RfaH
VDDAFLNALQLRTERAPATPQAMFAAGEVVTIAEGPFAGLEAIFQLKEGADRAAVLLDRRGQQVRAAVPYVTLRKSS